MTSRRWKTIKTTDASVRARAHARAQTHTHTHTHARAGTLMHARTHTHTRMHTLRRTHTHTLETHTDWVGGGGKQKALTTATTKQTGGGWGGVTTSFDNNNNKNKKLKQQCLQWARRHLSVNRQSVSTCTPHAHLVPKYTWWISHSQKKMYNCIADDSFHYKREQPSFTKEEENYQTANRPTFLSISAGDARKMHSENRHSIALL